MCRLDFRARKRGIQVTVNLVLALLGRLAVATRAPTFPHLRAQVLLALNDSGIRR